MSNELEIFGEEEIKHYRSYLPSPFITAALPLRDVNSPSFKREYNNVKLYLTGAPKVPYGKYARLLLSILTTHAVLDSNENGSVTIKYEKFSQLLNELQLPKQRGKDIREQLTLFSFTSFQYHEKITKVIKNPLQKSLFEGIYDEEGKHEAEWNNTGNIPFIKHLSYVDLKENEVNKATIAITVELGEDFVKICKEHSVPIDYTVYSKISSVVGKDLYAWLVYRNNCIKGEEETIFIPRQSLVDQFMPVWEETNKNPKEMERVNYQYILDQIRAIKENYYPELKINTDDSGITLQKSPAVIDEKDKRYILITNQ